jgi:hypothetical protein
MRCCRALMCWQMLLGYEHLLHAEHTRMTTCHAPGSATLQLQRTAAALTLQPATVRPGAARLVCLQQGQCLVEGQSCRNPLVHETVLQQLQLNCSCCKQTEPGCNFLHWLSPAASSLLPKLICCAPTTAADQTSQRQYCRCQRCCGSAATQLN